jgi:integrase
MVHATSKFLRSVTVSFKVEVLDLTAAEALKRYAREAGPKFAAMVERYLGKGGSNSDTVFLKYLRHLEQEGLRPGTVDLHRRTIQAFYRHFRLAPPQARGWHYDPHDASRPALAVELIAHLIQAAKTGKLTSRQTALLALSTTYGMRAGELAAVTAADVDLVGQRIYIRTLKGGKPRWCFLPPEIIPYVDASWARVSPNSVEKTFDNLWSAAVDAGRPDGTAWHSCRRALVRDLVAGDAPDGAVAKFLRWANGGSKGAERMVELYSRPSDHVGLEGTTPARTEDEGCRSHDELVWDRHPYLKFWL